MDALKILFPVFLSPERKKLNESLEHLGAASNVATLRQKGFIVKMMNINEDEFSEKLKEAIGFSPSITVFSTFAGFIDPVFAYPGYIERMTEFGEGLKASLPDMHITCYGYYATDSTEEMFNKYPHFDSIIRGESEETIVELALRISKAEKLDNCLGLHYQEDNKIFKNDERPLIKDLDTLPFPARDMLKESGSQFARIATTRGCTAQCAFCESTLRKIQAGPVWRGRSPEKVVDEIEHIMKECGVKAFFFIDSSFIDPGKKGKERARKIAELIIQRNLEITFCAYFRAEDFKTKEDEELLELLAKAGLEEGYVGIESGTQFGLELYNKRATLEDNYRIISLFDKYGIYLMAGFIMFHPYATLEYLKENADFLYKTKLGHILHHYIRPLEVYPNTAIAKRLESDNLILDDGENSTPILKYKYIDKEVSKLSSRISQILKEYHLEGECFDLHMSILLSRISKLARKNPLLMPDYVFLKESVDEIRNQLNENNYLFFKECLELVEKGWDDKTYSQLVNKYIDPFFIEKNNEMKRLFNNFGLKANRKGQSLRQIEGRCISA